MVGAGELAVEAEELEAGVGDALVELHGVELGGGGFVVGDEATVLHGDQAVGEHHRALGLDQALGELEAHLGVGAEDRLAVVLVLAREVDEVLHRLVLPHG